MQRLRIGRLLAGSLLLAAGLGSGGCADNESMLFVRGVIARLNGTCTVPGVPDDGTLILLGGVLDVALTNHYDAALIIGSQLTQRGDREELKTESSRIQIRGAEVQITGGGMDQAFTVDATGFVDPSASSSPGYGVAWVQLIPPTPNLPANAQLRVQVRVFGDTLGGTEIESGPLLFPISTCDGCLISFPQDAWDKALSTTYQCNSEDAPATDVCSLGQDEPVDCRLCAATYSRCVAP